MHYGITLFAHQLGSYTAGLLTAATAIDEGLSDGRLTAEGRLPEVITSLRESAELLDELLAEMLKMDDHCPCSLLVAIKQSEGLYRASLKSRSIEMIVKVDEKLMVDVPFYIISLAIANLISNSMDALKGNSMTILIEAEEGEEKTRCFFTDNGLGVASEIIERLTTEPVTTKKGRHGRGLMLVQESLCANGACIELTKPGPDGTTFTIELPKKR